MRLQHEHTAVEQQKSRGNRRRDPERRRISYAVAAGPLSQADESHSKQQSECEHIDLEDGLRSPC